jgi:hypothetical protein
MTEPRESKDLFTRLAEVGEDAIQKIADMPAAGKLTDTLNGLRTRVDELQRKVRGIDELERRVTALEKRVDDLGGKKPATRRRTTRSAAATKRKRATSAGSDAPVQREGGGSEAEPSA